MIETAVREQVAALFTNGGRLHGRFAPPEDGVLEEIVPGAVWQAVLWPDGSASAVLLRAYPLSNGNRILAHFWQNEVRALRRLSNRRLPSLPHLRSAGFTPETSLGYLILDDPGTPIEGAHPRLDALRTDRRAALRQILELCDGLALLHRLGMVHRTLTPHTLVALGTADAPVRIDGFQMSALVGSWMRGRGAKGPSPRRFLPASVASLACIAPEVIEPLFGGTVRRLEGLACDVFGLGMAAIPWFAGSHDEVMCAEIVRGETYDRNAHERVVSAAHERLRHADLPDELVRLLVSMTDPYAGSRVPSAIDALESLTRLYPSLAAQFAATSGATIARARHVYFLRETVDWIYKDGLARSAPEKPDEREYSELIARDLADAFVTWSPRGFEPWDNSEPEKTRAARVVLLGQRYTYFSQYYTGAQGEEDQRVLVIKYTCPAGKTQNLRIQARRTAAPPVDVAFFTLGGRRRPLPAGAPTWTDIIATVRFDATADEQTSVLKAARWLCGYAEGVIGAGCYAFERLIEDGAPTTGPIVLRATGRGVDERRDLEGPAFVDLLAVEGALEPMGAFFERLAEEASADVGIAEFLVSDETGNDLPVRLRFAERLDDDTVRFESIPGAERIGRRGRVRPDDRVQRLILSRQRAALRDLESDYELLAQLREPRGVMLVLPEDVKDVGVGLEDATSTLLRRILAEEPLFAVQGPPGTGKTFIASHVIAEVLRRDPQVRILVSSQSNAALDNLLRAVRRRDGLTATGATVPDFLILRHASREGESRVAEDAKDCLLTPVVGATRQRIEKATSGDAATASIARQWRALAKKADLDAELYFAVQRASNVVFATCAGSGANIEALRRGNGFDWVILEEAARAWLHEVVVPLVQGERWLLIGDQKQLPAYKKDDVERLLSRDVAERVTAEALGFAASESMRQYLGYFGHLMEAPVVAGDWTTPRERIEVQRRMHPDISGLVSTAFYDDRLRAHDVTRRPHMASGLSWAKGTALKWIDTSNAGVAAQERGRENGFELELVRAIADMLGTPRELERGVKPLLVLTPYRDQLKRMQQRVRSLPPEVFQSVDAVQGDEAEVVVVSLVRNNTFDGETRALGFLQAPERVNVMFSRARRLLLLVGSLTHFARFPATHWGRVTEYVRGDPRFVVDALTAIPQAARGGGRR